MAGRLKVWGGTGFHKGRQARFVIAARTKRRVVELADGHTPGRFTAHTLNTYWSETGNAAELELVRAGGGTEGVWVRGLDSRDDYERLHAEGE